MPNSESDKTKRKAIKAIFENPKKIKRKFEITFTSLQLFLPISPLSSAISTWQKTLSQTTL